MPWLISCDRKGISRKPKHITGNLSSLGKSKILVLHSEQPLFATMREISEPASAYAEALAQMTGNVRSLDSKILTTAEP